MRNHRIFLMLDVPTIVGIILFVIVLSIVVFLWWNAYFDQVVIQKGIFPGGHCIYTEFRGKVNEIGNAFGGIAKELGPVTDKLPDTDLAAIYFEDPKSLVDPSQWRAVIGVMVPRTVPKSEIEKLGALDRFKYKYLPPTNAVTTKFPFRSFFGNSIKHKQVVSRIHEFMTQNNLRQGMACPGIEIYRWMNRPDKHTEMNITYGPASKEYEISSYPPPQKKEGEKKFE